MAGVLSDHDMVYGHDTLYKRYATNGQAFVGGSSILQNDLALVSPNGGENWDRRRIHDITWTSTGTIANVNIDYSTDSGGSWVPMVADTANDGTYAWTVPSTPSTTCLVRVSDAANNDPSDSSNTVFSIS